MPSQNPATPNLPAPNTTPADQLARGLVIYDVISVPKTPEQLGAYVCTLLKLGVTSNEVWQQRWEGAVRADGSKDEDRLIIMHSPQIPAAVKVDFTLLSLEPSPASVDPLTV